tara:strand:+ start:51 stop:839 length:789 start_codon:yes stop_codon:yes gene_type:complete
MACTYCYQDGHNRRTCPTYTKRLQDEVANGNSYAQSLLDERGKGSGRKKSSRRCSFCKTRGHDRRSCNHANAYINKRASRTHAIRAKFYDKMVENELGIGSLVSFVTREWCYLDNSYKEITRSGLVRSILWEDITEASVNGSQQLMLVSYFYTGKDDVTKEMMKHVPLPTCVSMWSHDIDGNELEPIPHDSYRRKNAPNILSAGGAQGRDNNHTMNACKKETVQYIKDYDVDVWSHEFRRLFTREESDAFEAQNEKERQENA